jgi:transcriptional regulator with XRE-family HTH domain
MRLRRLASGLRLLDVSLSTGLSTSRLSEIERDEGPAPRPDELALIDAVLAPTSPKGAAKGLPS